MNGLLLLCIIIWLYIISVLKRANLTAYYFIFGSIGLFFILIALSNPYWIWFFTHSVITGVNLFSITDLFHIYTKYGLVYINNAISPVTMSIDYECSGIIETCAFLAMITFFPVYSPQKRLDWGLIGIIWIYLANIIRLFVVIAIVHFLGSDYYFVAHSILGRLVFYILIICLYYKAFTSSQIRINLYNFNRSFSQ